MVPWPVVRHALIWGGILSAIVSVLLLALLWANAEVMLGDYPPDIRAKFGPMSARTKRQKLFVSIIGVSVVTVVVTTSFAAVRASSGGDISFATAFVHLFV